MGCRSDVNPTKTLRTANKANSEILKPYLQTPDYYLPRRGQAEGAAVHHDGQQSIVGITSDLQKEEGNQEVTTYQN